MDNWFQQLQRIFMEPLQELGILEKWLALVLQPQVILAVFIVTIGTFVVRKIESFLHKQVHVVTTGDLVDYPDLEFHCESVTLPFYRNPLRHKQVQVVTTEKECNRVVARLRKDLVDYPVLGFDCEWVTRPFYQGPVALLQLSSTSGFTALIRLGHLEYIPVELQQLLKNEMILKVGVEPLKDAGYLRRDYNISVRGTLDLRYLALELKREPFGLAQLSQSFLGVDLGKERMIQCSEWDNPELTAEQIDYAANDAFVGIEIFKKMSKMYYAKKESKDILNDHNIDFIGWARCFRDHPWSYRKDEQVSHPFYTLK